MSSYHQGTIEAASSEGRDLTESSLLCSAMLALAVGWLAWSLPSPSARDALFVLLCLTLVVIEKRRASARFRERMIQVGETLRTAAREAHRGEGTSAAPAEGGAALTRRP